MAGKKVDLEIIEFASQKDAKAYFSNLLQNVYRKDGETVSDEHFNQLLALLYRHPEAAMKIGCGVKRFYAKWTPEKTRCFHLERTDGSTTDFSFHTAIEAKGLSDLQEFAEACRNAIKEDLASAKQKAFAEHANAEGLIKCEASGTWVTFDQCQLDHKPPLTFQVLVTTFISARCLTDIRQYLTPPEDNQYTAEFVDITLKEAFRTYHHDIVSEKGALRLISSKMNASLGGSNRIRSAKKPVDPN